ncbi:BTAD domain-containing putative transcriptional regulator [Dictyobacter kobayashii]|uniref:BTAD domain-containing putative transcriptional regulator n=1 Tax=Dictyobacter kobayashii TaxID=2014872 RepID=UPI000F83FA77|nr:BTAD domain-containing putative transcriptional regulator [Dictyobacter kobayashii]
MPALYISLLGDFLVMEGERPLTTVLVPRVQALLAYLLLHRRAPQDRAHLAFLLWPDSLEAQAHTNLRQLLYHLRQALPHAEQFLAIERRSVQWVPALGEDSFKLDVQELEQALVEAQQAEQVGDTQARRSALERVMQLYRGDLLPGCYDEWILPERDRWHQAFLRAAEQLGSLLEQECDYTAAIAVSQQLLRLEPLHEASYGRLMRLYTLSGERATALRTYHTCVRLLERELGAEPSAATQAIYETLMQPEQLEAAMKRPPNESALKRGTAIPLLGRKEEWRQLQKVWRKATGGIDGLQAGSAQLVMLSGETGIGKTRLANELDLWVTRMGIATARARCYAALGQLAYAPIPSWLRCEALQPNLAKLDPLVRTEVARLLPEVLTAHPQLSPPVAMTEGWQRQHFFAALARVLLAGPQPLLLLLDDMQWCDEETLQWIQYLFQFAPTARLLVVATVRAEETAPTPALATLLSALQRDGLLTELPLEPLAPTDTISLAEAILGRPLDAAKRATLYRESEGNPYFVVELAQAGLLERPLDVSSKEGGARPWFPRPPQRCHHRSRGSWPRAWRNSPPGPARSPTWPPSSDASLPSRFWPGPVARRKRASSWDWMNCGNAEWCASRRRVRPTPMISAMASCVSRSMSRSAPSSAACCTSASPKPSKLSIARNWIVLADRSPPTMSRQAASARPSLFINGPPRLPAASMHTAKPAMLWNGRSRCSQRRSRGQERQRSPGRLWPASMWRWEMYWLK